MSFDMAATIDSVVRYHATARMVDKILADHPDCPPAEIVSDLKTMAWAVQQRDGAIAKLALEPDSPDKAPWTALDAMQGGNTTQTPQSTNDATDAILGDLRGNLENITEETQ